MRRLQHPAKSPFNGSGFPRPLKGDREVSLINPFIRNRIFCLAAANTNNRPRHYFAKRAPFTFRSVYVWNAFHFPFLPMQNVTWLGLPVCSSGAWFPGWNYILPDPLPPRFFLLSGIPQRFPGRHSLHSDFRTNCFGNRNNSGLSHVLIRYLNKYTYAYNS